MQMVQKNQVQGDTEKPRSRLQEELSQAANSATNS